MNDEIEEVDTILFDDEQKKKINDELKKSLGVYRANIAIMSLDAPIGVLCLSKSIEKILLSNDIKRLYDLVNRDLREIKGINDVTARDLASCLDQFLSMGS